MVTVDTQRLASAVDTAVAGVDDLGAAELARTYARAIDNGGDLDKLGPLLLAVLESLGLTPKARAALVKGAKDEPRTSPLDELRVRRSARQRDATAVDPTAS
jgi:hypothetical protein